MNHPLEGKLGSDHTNDISTEIANMVSQVNYVLDRSPRHMFNRGSLYKFTIHPIVTRICMLCLSY